MAFVDNISIQITAGKGGDGVVRWRTEKFRPKSGPGGGNGGRGGNVTVEAVSDLSFLSNYQFKKHFVAENGHDGENYGKQGATGTDLVIKVPVGSIIKQRESGFVWDMDTVGKTDVLLRGGRGGLGNEWFKSSKNVSPIECTLGEPGESGEFTIELQMIADIGLIGLPSAGKSSLLNALTNADSKVAEYHFTTLEPHLGVMKSGCVIADIPGLIEGASTGKGLGIKFLRHIMRTRVLVHLISAINPDGAGSYKTIRNELIRFNPELGKKREIVLLSQCDEISDVAQACSELSKQIGVSVYPVSIFDDVLLKQFADMITAELAL